jgi:hypothetical protein
MNIDLRLLEGFALCFEAHTRRLPVSAKELAEYWELGGMYKTLDEIAEHHDTDHISECFWLREFAKRPDADALLAQAMSGAP